MINKVVLRVYLFERTAFWLCMRTEYLFEWKQIPMMILLAGALLGGCEQQAEPVPTVGPDTDTTICRVLKIVHENPSYSPANYTIDFTYDSQGRVDTAYYLSADLNSVTKFYYSIDDNPDSVITTNLPPAPSAGTEFRRYYHYDNNRRQISTTLGWQPNDITQYTYNSTGQLIMRDRKFFLGGVQVFDTVRFSYPNSLTHNFDSTYGRGTNGQLWNGVLYSYDNNPRPQKFPMNSPINDGNFAYGIDTDNNVVSVLSGGMEVQKLKFTYQEAGYPQVQTFALGPLPHPTWTFTYHCETIEAP